MDLASLGVVVTPKGVAETASQLDRLDKSASKAASSAGGLGKALVGIGAGYLVGRGIAAIITKTIEAEKAQAQLGAVLRSTAGAAGLSADALNKQAAALQAMTTFDDEAITGAQSLLLTFTKIGKDVFPKATEVVLDMSQALGQDLKSSATQLGKALQDPIKGITALSRVGVNFSDSQKKVITSLVESGKAAEAQQIILKELQTEFGGSARAARDTLGGALTGLKNDFDNLLEGDTGSAGVKGTVSAIKELSATLNSSETKAGFQAVAQGIANVTKFALDGINAFVGLGNAIKDALSIDTEKSYEGLLTKQSALVDDLNDLQSKNPLAKLNLLLGGRSGSVNPLSSAAAQAEKLKLELTAIGKLTGQSRAGIAARETGGSSGPTGGRGRGAGGETLEQYRKRKEAEKSDAKDAEKPVKSGRAAGLSDEARSAKALQDRYDGLNASLAEQVALYGKTGQEVQIRYQIEKGELSNLTGAQKESLLVQAQRLDQLAAESVAREKAIAAEEAETRAIKEHADAVKDLLADIAFETKLLGLSSAQKEKESALRYANADAATAEGQAILAAIDARQAAEKQAAGLDSLRDSAKSFFKDAIDGAGSFKDAVDSALDGIKAKFLELIAQKLTEKLFGAPGSTGTGASGGIGSILGAIFGSGLGRAIGGPVSAGGVYQTGEKNRPELLRINGKQFLIPGKNGSISADVGGMGGSSQVNNVTINVPDTTSRATADQVAGKVAAAISRAGRNR